MVVVVMVMMNYQMMHTDVGHSPGAREGCAALHMCNCALRRCCVAVVCLPCAR